MTEYPKVSIVMLNWNGIADTIECIESLKKITYPQYEIIVIDNASSGNDVELLSEQYRNQITVIANDQNYGFPGGCNIGMRRALSENIPYVLLLNNDTVVDPEFLTEMIRVAESNNTIGMVGSKIYLYYKRTVMQAVGGKIRWWLGDIETYGENEEDRGQWDAIAERDFVYGTSFLIKRGVIEKIGFMDTFFFFGIEEMDYCTRAKRAGFKIIYVPTSKVWHKVGADSSKFSEYPETFKIVRNRGYRQSKYYFRLFKNHCPPVLYLIPFISYITGIVFIRPALQWAIRGDFQKIGRGIKKRILELTDYVLKRHM